MPPPDFTDKYNTSLPPYFEAQFHAWAYAHDKLKDLADYDLRGFWLLHGGVVDPRGHGPDTFKKPNHPTFSNESMYSGQDGHIGGTWIQTGHDSWDFQASPDNLKYQTPQELQSYFQSAESGSQLILPSAQKAVR